jgi:hypothetical protein
VSWEEMEWLSGALVCSIGAWYLVFCLDSPGFKDCGHKWNKS